MFDQYSLVYTYWTFLMISSDNRVHMEDYMHYKPPLHNTGSKIVETILKHEWWLMHDMLQNWKSDSIQLAVGGWEYWLADDFHQLTSQIFTNSVPLSLEMVLENEQ